MTRTGFLLAAAGVFIAFAAGACSSDDDDDGDTTGSAGPPATTATNTPAPEDGASTPGNGGAAPALTSTSGVPPFPTDAEPPSTTVSANGQSVEAGIGTYCWTLLCVDKIGVPTKGTLTVSPGDMVSFAIPDGVPALREASAAAFEATGPQTLDDGSQIWPYPGAPGDPVASETTAESIDVAVDLAPGSYVLAVFMAFEAGDVVYGVLIEVE